MTIIANIYVYILDDKFGIQNPQIMAIGKLMNRGCERESMRVQGHKNESKKKRQSSSHLDSKKQRRKGTFFYSVSFRHLDQSIPNPKTKYRHLLSFFLLTSKVFEKS